jgi:PIN domain nuclease of toxin-antitoxin system
MRLLLDTDALLWTMNGSRQLSRKAESAIKDLDNEVFVSVGSIWEAAIKYRSGRLPQAAALLRDPSSALSIFRFRPLELELEHARLAGLLDSFQKDPFDRMIAAQAILEGLTLISSDAVFTSMPVTLLW